jgi:predicted ATPase/DNA-binding CsgD family transcriptional regulator
MSGNGSDGEGGRPGSGRDASRVDPARPPVPLTGLIGRRRELARLREILATSRLLTLTGPGGVGKTRLAVAVVDGLATDGVCWVALADLLAPADVPQAVARALGIREQHGRRLEEVLRGRLGETGVLLVLDNCEHVVDGVAALAAELLGGCAGLRVLATSRTPLGLTGEVTWPVPPLSVPDPWNPPPLSSLDRYEAVQLLTERAAAVERDFALSEQNASAVARLCYRLDGLPLAIELAAARLRVLSVEQVTSRLESSLAVLDAGSRAALPQQRTLEGTITWSHELLAPPQRLLFRRLAVFAGGFTLEAVESVCTGSGLAPADVLGLLTALVDQSLVDVRKDAAGVRYRLLETVRHYGLERLREAGEEQRVRARHSAYFLALAEQAEREINTPRREPWLDRLEAEQDDLRAVLAAGSGDAGPRLAGALTWFWWWRSYIAEGRRWLESMAVRTDVPSAVMAKVLSGAGLLAWAQGDAAAADRWLQRSVELGRGLDDPRQLAQALRFLSGTHELRGDLNRARSLVEESVALYRSVGDRFGEAMSLARLGVTAISQGDHPAAETALQAGIRICRDIGDDWVLAIALRHRGIGALRAGDVARASAALREQLELLRNRGDRLLTTQGLETLATVLACSGDHGRAAQLFGTLEVQRERLGLSVIYREDYDRGVAAARAGLGDRLFATMRARGRASSLEDAVELALAEPPAQLPRGLTEREAEVLAQVAQGLTNDEVAARLFLSSRTVNWHLTAIYRKLAVRSRTDAVRFAVEHGLDR